MIFVVVILIIGGEDIVMLFSLFSIIFSGIRLIINVIIRLFFMSCRFGFRFSIIVRVESVRIIRVDRVSVGVIVSTSATWICTKDVGS